MKTKSVVPWLALSLLAAAFAAGLWFAFRPEPLLVETAAVRRAPLEVTIEEQGETRAHDRYVVTAPVGGRMSRLDWHEGDGVARGQLLLTLHPLPLGAREREEADARIRSAEATERESQERIRQAETALDRASRERRRAETLRRTGDVAQRVLDDAVSGENSAREEVQAAHHRTEAARAEVARARAALLDVAGQPRSAPVPVYSPVAGRILQVIEKSERNVDAGAPLLSVGDGRRLEIVIDVLTTDAVKVCPGQTVWLDNWGGEKPLRAVVRSVEPLGFTKVSALGIEEKRVHVIADFVDAPGPLGDGYRVEARIVVWRGDNVLQAPASAVFRDGDGWAVFTAEGEFARRRSVEVGARHPQWIEIRRGLNVGDTVVTHPPRDLSDGARFRSTNSR